MHSNPFRLVAGCHARELNGIHLTTETQDKKADFAATKIGNHKEPAKFVMDSPFSSAVVRATG